MDPRGSGGAALKRSLRKTFGTAVVAAALGAAGAGHCAAGDTPGTPAATPAPAAAASPAPAPSAAPSPGPVARARQAVADRWEKVKRLPEAVRDRAAKVKDDAVTRASHEVPKASTPAPAPAPAPAGPTVTPVFWWSVPRNARTAARKYAAGQNRAVTRVVRVEEADGRARFQVYAAPLAGLKRSQEEVLITVDDPKSGVNRRP